MIRSPLSSPMDGAFGAAFVARGAGGIAPPPPSALISSVNADGWQAVWAGGTPPTFDPNGAPVFQPFERQGFDADGNAITFTENMLINRRVRQPFPNQLLNTASNVAMADYILSTDSATGVTNSSTEISPKPIANWVMRDRQMVGDTIEWEIIAFHYYARNNRQVACVRVRANDGTTQTPWQVVSTPVISAYCEDANPLEVYRGVLNISALDPGTVALPAVGWLEAEVMPWAGADNANYALSSVLKSEQSTVPREFSRRYFGRNVSRAANPPRAYVSSAGNDATGVWSLTAATAEALPFLTVTGALTAMTVGGNAAVTNSICDGCEISIVNAVSGGAAVGTARPQRVASLRVTRAPSTSRINAEVSYSASFRGRIGQSGLQAGLTEGAIFFDDMSLTRVAAVTINGEIAQPLQIAVRNVIWNNTNAATNPLSNASLYIFGLSVAGTNLNLSSTGAASQKRIMRGLVSDVNFTSLEAWLTLGCNITRPGGTAAEDASKPRIAYSNKWLNPSSVVGVTAWVASVSGGDIGPIVWAQNLLEASHTATATAGFRLANDSPAFGNIVHAVIHHNTNTGYNSVNRNNFAYDEAPVARFHKFISHVGDIPSQLNTKGDIFQGDGTRLGQFAYAHGVGCRGNFSMFQTNSAVLWSEFQTFPGRGSLIGTDPNTPQSPYATMYANYQGTTGSGGTPVAGAGGGTYTLNGGSPARGILANPVLSFDLAGNARPAANDAAGAYA